MRAPVAAAETIEDGASTVIANAARDLSKLEDGVGSAETLRTALEVIKARTDLGVGIAEISGAWTAGEASAARSEFAERLIETALQWLIRSAVNRGDLSIDLSEGAPAGIFALAGGDFAHEELAPYGPLDLAIFFDGAMSKGQSASMAERAFARIGAEFHEVFDGKAGDCPLFVLKTPLGSGLNGSGLVECLTRARAAFENPQETTFHKFLATARVVAGDRLAGGAFLEEVENVSFAPVTSVEAAAGADPRNAHRHIADVLRLGLGRARPIFRTAPARTVFEKAADAGVIPPVLSMRLVAGQELAAGLASRIQLINGGASFDLKAPEEKDALAALSGFEAYDALKIVLDGALADARSALPMLIEGPQADFNRYRPATDGPDDAEKLEDLGFSNGQYLSRVVDNWAGLAPCEDNARFSAVAPGLLTAFGQTQYPDEAVSLFDAMIEAGGGDDAVIKAAGRDNRSREIMVDALGCFGAAVAPLAATRPGAEALISADDMGRVESGEEWLVRHAPPEKGASAQELAAWRRENIALISLAAVAGRFPFGAAAQALRAVHRTTLERLFANVARETKTAGLALHIFDEPLLGLPGVKTLMGMIAADAATDATETCARAFVEAVQDFDRGFFAFAPDIAHRPGGVSGPLAPDAQRYKAYIQSEAIASDQVLFARARVIAGDADAQKKAHDVFRSAVSNPRRADILFRDLDRARTQKKRRERAVSEWDIERVDGGLYDSELIISTVIYRNAAAHPAIQECGIADALSHLVRADALDAGAASTLIDAREFWGRLAVARALARWSDPQTQPVRARFAQLLARAAEVERFDQVRPLMRGYAEEVNRLYAQLVLGRPSVSLVASAS